MEGGGKNADCERKRKVRRFEYVSTWRGRKQICLLCKTNNTHDKLNIMVCCLFLLFLEIVFFLY